MIARETAIALMFVRANSLDGEASRDTVREIAVELTDGAGRTRPSAVRRLMNTCVGQKLDGDTLERDLARLAATHIIYDPRPTVEPRPGGCCLKLRVKDKWSPLPIVAFRRGGARTTAAIGVWDNNVMGRLFTLSAELQSNADLPFVRRSSADRTGHLVYAVVPRIAATRLSPAFYWSRDFYDFGRWDPGGNLGFVYDRARTRLLLLGRYEISNRVTATLGAVTYRDRFRRNRDYSAARDEPPRSGRSTALLGELQLGFIRENLSRFQGKQATAGIEIGRTGLLLSDFGYTTLTMAGKALWVPREGHNVGVHVAMQATSGTTDSHLPRAGGLGEIRGFLDASFVGQRILRGNIEYRVEVLEHAWPLRSLTQVVGFVDGGHVASRAGAVAGLDYEGPVASAGAGLRVNLVPLARATGRADLAFALHPYRRIEIALGTQQFF